MKRAFYILMPLAILTVVVSSWALSSFFDRYSSLEMKMRKAHNYTPDSANAIKHAIASADVFNLLRQPLGDDLAEKTVIKLGLFNEYLERLTYRNDPDSARAIMKDLHNNYAGIQAAKLADDTEAFDVVLSFTANNTLIIDDAYNPFFESVEPTKDVVNFSYKWFKNNYDQIDRRIERKVARAKDLRPLLSAEASSLDAYKKTYQ